MKLNTPEKIHQAITAAMREVEIDNGRFPFVNHLRVAVAECPDCPPEIAEKIGDCPPADVIQAGLGLYHATTGHGYVSPSDQLKAKQEHNAKMIAELAAAESSSPDPAAQAADPTPATPAVPAAKDQEPPAAGPSPDSATVDAAEAQRLRERLAAFERGQILPADK